MHQIQGGYQLGFSSEHTSMFDEHARRQKARKAVAVLGDLLGPLQLMRLLEVGCSTGILCGFYAESFANVVGIDIDEGAVAFAKARELRSNVEFFVGDAMATGLPSDSFDVVACTHVYEHVPDARLLMKEIYRVLKPGGVCYFAAGNRIGWIEAHYRLPLLSVVPKSVAHRYLRVLGRGEYYYENHLTLQGLRELVRDFEIVDYTSKVINDPVRFESCDVITPHSCKQLCARLLVRVAYWLVPTYLWVLRKPKQSTTA